MTILGLSAFSHDSAACVVRDGEVVAAAQEERFDRIKNTEAFPLQAINECVLAAGISFADIERVAYYEKPYLRFARVLSDHVHGFPFTWRAFLRSMPKWLDQRLAVPMVLEEELGFEGKPYFVKHHLSHAAAAFLPSGFEEAAILTVDGVGEWAAMTAGRGRGSEVRIEKEILYPDSLGLFYTTVTAYLGFEANEAEGTTMALAACGEPRFLDALRGVLRLSADGSFRLEPGYFAFRAGERMWSGAFERLLGAPRLRGAPIDQRHRDVAASAQKLLEEALLGAARNLREETGSANLCLAGGVALNCVANTRILKEAGFEKIFVQPAAGDAGGAMGAALYVSHCLEGAPRRGPLEHVYLGPEFNEREIASTIRGARLEGRKLSEGELLAETAKRLHKNKVVGWFQGRMEFGPRALGNRSLLANPCHAAIKEILNERVKGREEFRPYAPLVLEEKAGEYFDLGCPSPFMLLAPKIRPEAAPKVPGIVHADGSARVQTLGERSGNPRMRGLLREFEKLSGVPMLVNTSFNVKGEPVVCRPAEAVDCFKRTKMDCLVIGDYLVER